ncbi:hypothetical protein HanXRQr2_Chr16g0752111 [Helianthus annuus]|uniref:Uncharacterized protein n=1 Tax=Helianthus annuus TaxID=4232 RepID=A0A9K3DRQ8_HELAN|nr:hypothetical protein HanXRQr2_Chr16g0752111 [Helianthus annuus]KAJ0821493.1 hypothetical protein HanPSC8_Chr16g0720881 [Helianthus annuus]
MANNIAITFTPFIFSWKNTTAKTGTIGIPKVLITFENNDETSNIKPTQPIEKICHETAVHTKFIMYETLPDS